MESKEEIIKMRMQRICKKVQEELPDGCGFVVLAFEFGNADGKEMVYGSNANREDIVRAMEEWIEKTRISFGNDTGKY